MVGMANKRRKCEQVIVVQDNDPAMTFHQGDNVRLIYLTNTTVRVDSAY